MVVTPAMERRRRKTLLRRAEPALAQLAAASTDEDAFHAIPKAASAAYDLGRFAEAERLATRSISRAAQFSASWNCGNALHVGHTVLGLLALQRGRPAGGHRSPSRVGQRQRFTPAGFIGPDDAARTETPGARRKRERSALLRAMSRVLEARWSFPLHLGAEGEAGRRAQLPDAPPLMNQRGRDAGMVARMGREWPVARLDCQIGGGGWRVDERCSPCPASRSLAHAGGTATSPCSTPHVPRARALTALS